MSPRRTRSPWMALGTKRRWGAGTLLLLVGVLLGASGCGADAGADDASDAAAVVDPAGPDSSQADPAAGTDDDPPTADVDLDVDVTTTAIRNTTTRAPSSSTSSTVSSSLTSPTTISTTTSTTSVTTPSSTTNSQTTLSTTGTTAPVDDGGGLGDVIGCQVLESRDALLEVLNSSQEMQNYGVAFELLDGDDVTGDSYAFIIGLRPGERTREAAQTMPHTASSCRVTAVEPSAFPVDTIELEAVSDCTVDLNAIGVAGLMTVTNRTGSLVDWFEGIGAVYDSDGVRRATGRILSDSVPDGGSRPASLQTFAQTTSVAGWTCRVIEIGASQAGS